MNEIIREKILLNYDKEIPYSVEVEVDTFKEEEQLIRIQATIYVERDSQKGIIIGSLLPEKDILGTIRESGQRLAAKNKPSETLRIRLKLMIASIF